ncbi:MAG: biotin--[acetyl-CoA-carboxylase] ligase [Acidobacteria bacterium]|nr:biotin--[acetyl-CoA-carboxylase] ligase [Acidobacteriota bacterium]
MKFIHLDSTDSTNTQAFRYLEHFDPVVITADSQHSGRGRGKNRWESPPGNIYLSVGTTTETPFLSGLSVRAAIHVVSRLNPLLEGEKLCIKWPNDIFFHDKKVAGILTESRITAVKASVAVGIGLNTSVSPLKSSIVFPLPAEVSRESAVQLLAKSIFDALSDMDFSRLGKKLTKFSWFQTGDPVRFKENGILTNGVFEGYDSTLAMVVRSGNKKRSITVSEVSKIRKS